MEWDRGAKRKAHEGTSEAASKKQKTKKQWKVPRKADSGTMPSKVIQPGDSGIWATCDKGREAKCIGELRDLFAEYAETLYDDPTANGTVEQDATKDDIEQDIRAEINELRGHDSAQLFTPLRVDVQCVVFIKTIAPVDPVVLVKRICEDAMSNSSLKRTRFVKRLTPMTLIGRASAEGLEKVAKEVLSSHFHQEPFQGYKFAIRPSLRNHNTLTRDGVINQVASIVGPGHEVNLKDYDLLVLVEVYQNVCGVSVVDDSFERLKRYNLAEIFDPKPKGKDVVPGN